MDFTQAIYDKIVGDATIASLVARYPSGSPSNLAVFTGWPVPSDATRPYIFSRGEVAQAPFDDLGSANGRDVLRDVFVIDDNGGSENAVETLAEAVRATLHRQKLTFPGAVGNVMTICVAGPFVAETDNSLTGRGLTFRIVAKET